MARAHADYYPLTTEIFPISVLLLHFSMKFGTELGNDQYDTYIKLTYICLCLSLHMRKINRDLRPLVARAHADYYC